MMHLIDIREPDGPYGAAYQATRARDHIIDNPGMVPDWFVAKLARERVAAARVALEQLTVKATAPEHEQRAKVWGALRTIELFIREGHTLDPAVEQVVAGLLGAQEIATERERRDAERENTPPTELAARQEAERIALADRHLDERGVFDGTLAEAVAALSKLQREQRDAADAAAADMWAALNRRVQDGRIR